jgi:quinol monooxygenase YgiN
VAYGYINSIGTKAGGRDAVVAILLAGADGLRAAGCLQYTVAIDPGDDSKIWVTEVWESKEHHQASLELPETEAAIAEAMPLLTGEFHPTETTVVGGLGLD